MEKVVIKDCTLYLADCRDVLPQLPGPVDFILTDPPYGHKNNDGDLIHNLEKAIPNRRKAGDDGTMVYEARPIANDGQEAHDLLKDMLPHYQRLLVPGGCAAVCCGGGGSHSRPDSKWEPTFAWWSIWMDELLQFKQAIVWDKGPMGIGWHYRRSYEFVLVAMKKGAACKWYDDTDQIENMIRPGYKGIRKIIPGEGQHPTPKPVELAEHFVGLHTKVGETVLDPCMGTAWVGAACVALGRKFIGIEIDRQWFDMACKRIEDCYGKGSLFDEITETAEADPFAGIAL